LRPPCKIDGTAAFKFIFIPLLGRTFPWVMNREDFWCTRLDRNDGHKVSAGVGCIAHAKWHRATGGAMGCNFVTRRSSFRGPGIRKILRLVLQAGHGANVWQVQQIWNHSTSAMIFSAGSAMDRPALGAMLWVGRFQHRLLLLGKGVVGQTL